jgi:hypothetical protein
LVVSVREVGGDFPSPAPRELAELAGPSLATIFPGATLWASGRAALLAAVLACRAQSLHVPGYVCREVTDALAAAGVRVVGYPDHPLARPAVLPSEGGLVLRINYFGRRGAEEALARPDVIEDHTHDPVGPWARASRARFAFASLRKTFPMPDGAILWSPSGEKVPEPPPATSEHLAAAELKLRGMVMKRQYLAGGPVVKQDFRALLDAGEARGRSRGSTPTRARWSRRARRSRSPRLAAAPSTSWRPRVRPRGFRRRRSATRSRSSSTWAAGARGIDSSG